VLVDEYQDTNVLQAEILYGLCPDGKGLTAVGDDAQSIYSFRAATVRNILDFPKHYKDATVVTLEQNYRSTEPILAACNSVIGCARERFSKTLFSKRASQQLPILAVVEDESSQAEYVAEHILLHREAGIPLRRQAVLIRTSHHSDLLEVELGRRDIPFVKFGGLKFLEASHVKDLLCVLRWVENPRDSMAGFRVLQLLPGFGPTKAKLALDHLEQHSFAFEHLPAFRPPAPARNDWGPLCALLSALRNASTDWSGQVGMARSWYRPHLERIHDSAAIRDSDLEQLEALSANYPSRQRFLTELTLDPPDATGDEAGPPHLDEDYTILSTIHSAKGQEWDVVFVLNASDGCIPSDMSTANPEQIEEERRLLYVAMTRARDHLYLVHPQRFYKRQQHRHGDSHVYAPLTRFLPDESLAFFERDQRSAMRQSGDVAPTPAAARIDVTSKLRSMWD
jgi:DNA helicase-2/ATP-dependent DNA helicase PcrA